VRGERAERGGRERERKGGKRLEGGGDRGGELEGGGVWFRRF